MTLETQIATKLLVFPTVSNYTGYPCKTICNYVTPFSQFATTLAIPVAKFASTRLIFQSVLTTLMILAAQLATPLLVTRGGRLLARSTIPSRTPG